MMWHERRMMILRSPEDGGGAGGTGAGAAGGGAAGAGDGAAGGAGGKPWFDGIDATTIGHWDNKGWDKIKDDPKALTTELTKAWKELEKHFGAPADQIIKLPKDTSDEAGWKSVWSRLGVPDDAKGYDLSAIKRADGSDLDQAFADTMRSALLAGRVPKDRATEVVKAAVKHQDDIGTAAAAERAAKLQSDRSALLKEWGANAEFNRLTAMQGAKRLGVTEQDVAGMENAIGYRRTMELFHKIGAGTSEDTFVDAGSSTNPTTQNGAKARIAELVSDPAWTARLTSGDLQAKREYENLMQLAHGEAA